MEVILAEGDVVKMPKGCIARVEGDKVTAINMENTFEDGTIFFNPWEKCISIYKRYTGGICHIFHVSLYPDGQLIFEDYEIFFKKSEMRIATAEECKRLFDALKDKGFRWNAEIQEIEKIRSRARLGEDYFYIDARVGYDAATEEGNDEDEKRFNNGNYFDTKEQAAAAAKVVKKALKKFHERKR